MEQPARVTALGTVGGGTAVRAGSLADLDGIEQVERLAFVSDQLSRRSLRRFLGVGTTATVVAAAGSEVLGYAMVGFRKGSAAGRVFTLAVRPGAEGQGLGRALLAACEEQAVRRGATRTTLEVRADNAPARRLYDRAGYHLVDMVEDYYEDGAAAVRLAKALDPA